MPAAMQPVVQLLPTTQFVTLTQAILFRSAGVDVVWPQLLGVTAAGGIDPQRVSTLADALVATRRRGAEVVLVSSGAIAAGLADAGAGVALAARGRKDLDAAVNAIGGSAKDYLFGNAVSNNLSGNGGNDVLNG